MKSMVINRLLTQLCGIVLFFGTGFASSVPSDVKKGNRLYGEGSYEEALTYYNNAESEAPDSDIISFNKGAALYRIGEYDKAIEAFSKALLSSRPAVEEKAAYNIGNSRFRAGQRNAETDIAAAVNLYRQALDSYKRALELNQDNKAAKYNHEFVQKELEILEEKLKEQPEKSGRNDRQEPSEEQEQEQEQNGSNDSDQQQPSAPTPEDDTERRPAGDETKEDKQTTQQQYPDHGQQPDMTEEQARMLLDRYGQSEHSMGIMDWDGRAHSPVIKDW